MPGIVDWKLNPLQIIDQIFSDNHQSTTSRWSEEVTKYFNDRLSPSEWRQIPSLNGFPNHVFVDGQIVRFRGMIQDMFDPEFYLSAYEFKDTKSGQLRISTSCFRDTTCCSEDEINFESPAHKIDERMSYFCVEIPGESPWVSQAFKDQAPSLTIPSASNFKRDKRSREDDDEEEMEVESVPTNPSNGPNFVQSKKSKPDDQMDSESKAENSTTTLNSAGQSVIVKLYGIEEGSLSLNDAVEFIGILSMDPNVARASFVDQSTEELAMANDVAQFDRKEIAAKNPPTSLVPRLHVLKFVKLSSCNPLLSIADNTPLNMDFANVRSELHSYLTNLLLGDGLCADYLICHLVSKVYQRRDVLCLGKFSLNIFQVPLDPGYTSRLAEALQLLVCKSKYLPLTVENLNKMVFVPKKDYEANRLVGGFLQLSPHTHLILDETAMENGQLNTEGVQNLTALGNLISWQKLAYNFNFHNIEFLTDVPCLVLSEGRSMLPSDVQLLIKPQFNNIKEAMSQQLNPDCLNRIRTFISYIQHSISFDLKEDIADFVQEDFVRDRSLSQGSVSPDDLHSLLVLSRLMAVSKGQTTLSPEVWTDTKRMEKERKERMSHLPARPGGR